MMPKNWGKTEYEDEAMIPKNWGKTKYKEPESQSQSTVPNLPYLRALTSPVADHSWLVEPESILYDQWIQRKGSPPVWIEKPGRDSKRLGEVHRGFVRETIRSFNDNYIRGRTTGRLASARIILYSIKIDVTSTGPDDPELKLELLAFLKGILGDDKFNLELQHFYKMVEQSTLKNFWLLEHHPMLMGIMERYTFPFDTHMVLQVDDVWEEQYKNFVDSSFSPLEAECNIKQKITSHPQFLKVFNMNDNNHTTKGFIDNCVGLARFASALRMHEADHDTHLPPADVERELSNRFPFIFIQLYQFLFQRLSQTHDLAFLDGRRSLYEGTRTCF